MTRHSLLLRNSRPARSVPLLAGLLVIPAAGMAQDWPEWPPPPTVHFAASGEYSFSSGRISVDVPILDGSELTVTLVSPSGNRETVSTTRSPSGRRSTWTGRLPEPGTWRAEVVVEGPNQSRASGEASVSLMPGEPNCSVSLSAPEMATHYLDAAIQVNTCDASAVTGSIANRYVRVLRDGVQVAGVDASDSCERTFILPGDGTYEAVLEVTDDRGVASTCSASELDVVADHPRYWPVMDALGGVYRSSRADIVDPPQSSALAGAGLGITIPHDAAAARTTAFTARAGGGIGTNRWGASSFDLILTRQTPGGFFGAGAGLWGLGDPDIVDASIFATGGVNLDGYYKAGATQLLFELRGFARHITSFTDNFAAAVGFRVNFKDTHKLRSR